MDNSAQHDSSPSFKVMVFLTEMDYLIDCATKQCASQRTGEALGRMKKAIDQLCEHLGEDEEDQELKEKFNEACLRNIAACDDWITELENKIPPYEHAPPTVAAHTIPANDRNIAQSPGTSSLEAWQEDSLGISDEPLSRCNTVARRADKNGHQRLSSESSSKDHLELSNQINSECLETLQSEYNGSSGKASGGASIQLRVCHCDFSSVLIETILQCFSGGVCKLVAIEEKMRLLSFLLETTSDIASRAKKDSSKLLDVKYANNEKMCGRPLSLSLRAMTEKSKKGSTNEDDFFVNAARGAVNKHENNTKKSAWKEYAALTQPVKSVILLTMFICGAARTLERISLKEFLASLEGADKEELEGYLPFCQFMCGQPAGELSLAKVVETVIVPARRGSEEERLKSLGLTRIFLRELVRKRWRPRFKVAESVPADRLLESCSEEEINTFVSELTNPFLSEVGDSSSEDKYEYRRKIALRALFYAVHSFTVAETLHSMGHLDGLDERYFPFSLLCSTPSSFRDSNYNFFTDIRLHRASNEWDKTSDKKFLASVKTKAAAMPKTCTTQWANSGMAMYLLI